MGCRVFTLPPEDFGKAGYFTYRGDCQSSLGSSAAVPPVEIISNPIPTQAASKLYYTRFV